MSDIKIIITKDHEEEDLKEEDPEEAPKKEDNKKEDNKKENNKKEDNKIEDNKIEDNKIEDNKIEDNKIEDNKKEYNKKSVSNLNNSNFSNSNIKECTINGENFNKLKYRSILNHIYSIIGDGVKIIKKSNLNIKIGRKEDDGFTYLEDLLISIQGVDSNKCLKEISNQCIENKISIYLKIELNDLSQITINL